MKSIKNNLFKLVNVFMVVFSICTMFMNHVGVNVLNADAATSSINGDNFEYKTSDNLFMFKKNGKLIGFLPTDRKFNFAESNSILNFNNNAIGVGIAAAVGKSVGNAAATIGGGALAGGAAMLSVPGTAAVEATLAGAGVAAAEAAAAAAATTATTGGALIAIAGPVGIGICIGALGA